MKAHLIGLFVQLAIAIVLLIGYVKCWIHLLSCDFEANWKAEIIYGVGCCTGLGGVIGWFEIGI